MRRASRACASGREARGGDRHGRGRSGAVRAATALGHGARAQAREAGAERTAERTSGSREQLSGAGREHAVARASRARSEVLEPPALGRVDHERLPHCHADQEREVAIVGIATQQALEPYDDVTLDSHSAPKALIRPARVRHKRAFP